MDPKLLIKVKNYSKDWKNMNQTVATNLDYWSNPEHSNILSEEGKIFIFLCKKN
jgi:hypothetical protein